MPAEKLQKLMAQAGLGSRRACEQIIRQGRVTLNGAVAQLGERADWQSDAIHVDGIPLQRREPLTYVALHKPPGVLSSSQSQGGHPTVLNLVKSTRRLYPVGRLDLDSEGLVLLTNDGELANRLTHPSFQHEKEYHVQLDRAPTAEELHHWREGVRLADGFISSRCRVEPEGDPNAPGWVRVILTEGRKRQIRMMAEALGLRVQRLIRTRISSLKLGELASGRWRELNPEEVTQLRLAAGLTAGGMPGADTPEAAHGGSRDGNG